MHGGANHLQECTTRSCVFIQHSPLLQQACSLATAAFAVIRLRRIDVFDSRCRRFVAASHAFYPLVAGSHCRPSHTRDFG